MNVNRPGRQNNTQRAVDSAVGVYAAVLQINQNHVRNVSDGRFVLRKEFPADVQCIGIYGNFQRVHYGVFRKPNHGVGVIPVGLLLGGHALHNGPYRRHRFKVGIYAVQQIIIYGVEMRMVHIAYFNPCRRRRRFNGFILFGELRRFVRNRYIG
jgi:hypothetical protein